MSGRASLERVIERFGEQGFQPNEIKAILEEASRRMSVVGKAADDDFYQTCISTGVVALLLAFGMVMIAGYPQHGRGVGILYSAVFIGLGALAYGTFGKMFRR
ncbi:MAG: hypothetical protein B7X90_07495 [Novosphingobium sp. 17-62-19]|uniref:hypothetical protein n=1 Tax=Novosphingobium sp. 17-62-19 TaxID=1970406 RepID=UPI000BC49BFD|nr:hypothetical protein [Novosphingobium sp. 17-62-19]OZA19895.1 MAG: hypothetical protein B7X90_07495 [Novosphingobium sp. 17-62-19]HQS98568.1 hypothetical protein [Novosphingobium sp.]